MNYVEMGIDGNIHRVVVGDDFFNIDYQKLMVEIIEVIVESDAHRFDIED